MPDDPTQKDRPLDRNALLAIADAGTIVSRELVLERVFEQIAHQAASVLRAQGASVMLLASKTNRLIFQTAIGPYAQDLVGQTFNAGLGIAGQALRAQHPIRICDAQHDDAFLTDIDRHTGGMTHALIAAPMIHDDQPVGVVEVLNPLDGGNFTDDDTKVLAAFANVAAAAVHLALRYDRTRHRAAQTKTTVTIVGGSPAIATVIELCRKVAPAETTVLVTGETGTGKELVVRTIHELSNRHGAPLIPVNCAALPEHLVESELFGHRKGAFTDACADKVGLFEQAQNGTLFLDEVGELNLSVQSKLLRVLEQRQVVRIGDTTPIPCNVRLIAATNRDLRAEVEAGRFREDLYYRLHVFTIGVPPLRERSDDIPRLTDHFLGYFASRNNHGSADITDRGREALRRYAWPGNIRQLRNTLERALILADGDPVDLEHLPLEMHQAGPAAIDPSVDSALDSSERGLIVHALRQEDGNLSAAARSLKVTRDLLRYRVRKYDISPSEYGRSQPT